MDFGRCGRTPSDRLSDDEGPGPGPLSSACPCPRRGAVRRGTAGGGLRRRRLSG